MAQRDALPVITRELAIHMGAMLAADAEVSLGPADEDIFGIQGSGIAPVAFGNPATLPDFALLELADLLKPVNPVLWPQGPSKGHIDVTMYHITAAVITRLLTRKSGSTIVDNVDIGLTPRLNNGGSNTNTNNNNHNNYNITI